MEKEKTNEKSQGLSKVLGPMHIWALGVGIVLVGEFMGWNFTVAKGGSIGSCTLDGSHALCHDRDDEYGDGFCHAGGRRTVYNGEIYAWTFSCI